MAKDNRMKDKNKASCPALLASIIQLVNTLPIDARERFNQVCDERKIFKDENGNVIQDSAQDAFDKEIVEFLFDRESNTNSVERFEYLVKAKTLLSHFADLSNHYQKIPVKKRNNSGEITRLLYKFLTVDFDKRRFTVDLGLNLIDGFIKPVPNEFLELFQKFNIPFYRIRSCQVCQNVFWAKKLNAKTCQPKCSKKLYERARSKRLKAITTSKRDARDGWKNQDLSSGRFW